MNTIAHKNVFKIACCLLMLLLFGKSVAQVDGGPVQVEKSESVHEIEEVGLGTWLLSVFDFGDISDASDAKKAGKTTRCQGIINDFETQREMKLKVLGTLDKDCFWADVINNDPEDIGYNPSASSSMVMLHFHYYEDPSKNGVEFKANNNAKTAGVQESHHQEELNNEIRRKPLLDEEGRVNIDHHNDIVEFHHLEGAVVVDVNQGDVEIDQVNTSETNYWLDNADEVIVCENETVSLSYQGSRLVSHCNNGAFDMPNPIDLLIEGSLESPNENLRFFWTCETDFKIYPENEVPNNLLYTEPQNWFASIFAGDEELCVMGFTSVPFEVGIFPESIEGGLNEKKPIRVEIKPHQILEGSDLSTVDNIRECKWVANNPIDDDSNPQSEITLMREGELEATVNNCSVTADVRLNTGVSVEYLSSVDEQWYPIPNDLIVAELGDELSFRIVNESGPIEGNIQWRLYDEVVGDGDEVRVAFAQVINDSKSTLNILLDGSVLTNVPILVEDEITLSNESGYNILDLIRVFLIGEGTTCSFPETGIVPRCLWEKGALGELPITPGHPYFTLPFYAGMADALYEEIKGALKLGWTLGEVVYAWTPPGCFDPDSKQIREESLKFLTMIADLILDENIRNEVVGQVWGQIKDFAIETADVTRQAKYNQGKIFATVAVSFVPVAGWATKLTKGTRIMVAVTTKLKNLSNSITAIKPILKLAQGASKFKGKVVTFGQAVGDATRKQMRVMVLSLELYRFDGVVIRSSRWAADLGKGVKPIVVQTSDVVDMVVKKNGPTIRGRFEVIEVSKPGGGKAHFIREHLDNLIARGPPNLISHSKFKSLSEGLKRRLFNDMDASPGLGAKLDAQPDLVDAWKKMSDLNADDILRQDPKVVEVLSQLPKDRPNDPTSYLPAKYVREHLAKFDDGAIRFTTDKYPTLGNSKAFVMPKSEFDKLMIETGGDLRAIEQKLSLSPGRLTGENVVIAWIKKEDFKGLEIPSGKEPGVDADLWLPGGKTAGGVSEAILDLSDPNLKKTLFPF